MTLGINFVLTESLVWGLLSNYSLMNQAAVGGFNCTFKLGQADPIRIERAGS